MATRAQENSDLLEANGKALRNGNSKQADSDPPDGGFRAYLVVAGSFLTNGVLFGVINSYSIIYTVLEKQLVDEGVSNAESKASLAGALAISMTFLLSPISGVLIGLLGLRTTAVVGSSIAVVSLIISSFVTHSVNALIFTYGILYGMGASLAYTPSLAVLGHYFKKRLGLANGVVTIGSSVFTVIMPPVMEFVLSNYGLDWLFRILAVLAFCVGLCGLLFKPLQQATTRRTREGQSCKSQLKNSINMDLWKIRNYKFWALSMPIALFGYFVPYVHIKKFIMKTFSDVNYNLPLQCIATTSGLGRLFFGFIADKPKVDTVFLQQIAFYVIGSITIILPFVKSFYFLVALSLLMGIFDGAFIALIGPIAIKLAGAENAAQGIGCMLGLAATPLSIGPPIAGYLYGIHKDYTLPFVVAGISPLIGATVMFTVRYRCCGKRRPEANGHAVPMAHAGSDRERLPVLQANGKQNQKTTL